MAELSAGRIAFLVLNLPVDGPLRCGPFTLVPEGDPEQARERLRELRNDEALVTARGFADLALLPDQPATAPEAFSAFWQPARALELLLSFANRCRIQFVEPTFEVAHEGQWQPSAWPGYIVRRGRTRPLGWYVFQQDLEAFLEHAYPKLRDPSFCAETGIELALAYYDADHAEDELEINYLKVWTAVEVLVARGAGGRGIVAKAAFGVVRKQLEDALAGLQVEGVISETEREALQGGLGAQSAALAASGPVVL